MNADMYVWPYPLPGYGFFIARSRMNPFEFYKEATRHEFQY